MSGKRHVRYACLDVSFHGGLNCGSGGFVGHELKVALGIFFRQRPRSFLPVNTGAGERLIGRSAFAPVFFLMAGETVNIV